MTIHYFNIQNKFNIVTTQKIGCTSLCKYVSEWLGIFEEHNHSYNTNHCSKHKYIHNCMSKKMSFNPDNKTYIVYRLPEERVLSYYLGNYYGDLSFDKFVDKVITNQISHGGHLTHYNKQLKEFRYNISNYEIILLKNLITECKTLAKTYNLDFPDIYRYPLSSGGFVGIENYESGKLYEITRNMIGKYNIKNRSLFFTDKIREKINNLYKDDLEILTV